MTKFNYLLFVSLFFIVQTYGMTCIQNYKQHYNYEKAIGSQIMNRQLDNLSIEMQKVKNQIDSLITNDKSKTKSLSSLKEPNHFTTADLEGIGTIVLTSQLRVIFFKLQAMSRMFEKIYEEDEKSEKSKKTVQLANLRADFKKYEDLLGKIDLQEGLLKVATPLENQDLVNYFKNKKLAAIRELIVSLKNDQILENPLLYISQHKKLVTAVPKWKKINSDSLNSNKDAKEMKNFVAHELHEMLKIMAKEAEKAESDARENKFTNEDIEKGFHEFRRKLRWLVIDIQSLSGLIKYAPEQSSLQELPRETHVLFQSLKLQNPKLTESSYLNVGPSEIKHPIIISKILLAMTSELVTTIGNKKDAAEKQIYIHEALTELGVTQKEQLAIIAKLNANLKVDGNIDHQALSQDFQNMVVNAKLLSTFAKSVRELNDHD